jgi:hypothetical protein
LSAEQLTKWFKGNDILAMVILTQHSEETEPKLDPEVQQVLDQYDDVYTEPQKLPLERNYDHTILLILGVVPINSRPYRYFPRNWEIGERNTKS